jgi:hypothetical protein
MGRCVFRDIGYTIEEAYFWRLRCKRLKQDENEVVERLAIAGYPKGRLAYKHSREHDYNGVRGKK